MQAWLNLTPKGSAQSNGDHYGHLLPDLPGDVRHLPGLLHEIGTCARGAMGLNPLTFTEIHAWSTLMRCALDPFEVSAVRHMSEAYARVASDADSPCPVEDERIQDSIMAANIASWIAVAKANTDA